MDFRRPISLAASPARAAVLHVLVRSPEALSGREVARRARISQSGAAKALGQLVRHGIVDRAERPPAASYLLNRAHLAAGPIAGLVEARDGMLDLLREYVGGWDEQPISVLLFGSVARGDAGLASDIDLLVVTPSLRPQEEWAARLSALERAVERWTGNPATVIEYTRSQIDRADVDRAFLEALRNEAITVVGQSPAQLMSNRATR